MIVQVVTDKKSVKRSVIQDGIACDVVAIASRGSEPALAGERESDVLAMDLQQLDDQCFAGLESQCNLLRPP